MCDSVAGSPLMVATPQQAVAPQHERLRQAVGTDVADAGKLPLEDVRGSQLEPVRRGQAEATQAPASLHCRRCIGQRGWGPSVENYRAATRPASR